MPSHRSLVPSSSCASALSQMFCCGHSRREKPSKRKPGNEWERRNEAFVGDLVTAGDREALDGEEAASDTISSQQERCSFSSFSLMTVTIQTPPDARSEDGADMEEARGESGGTHEQRSRRAVNVVAQLMGLENLPPFCHRSAGADQGSLCSTLPAENAIPAVLCENPAIAKTSERTIRAVVCRNPAIDTSEIPACRNSAIGKNAKRTIDAVLCRNPVGDTRERYAETAARKNPSISKNAVKRTTEAVANTGSSLPDRATDTVMWRNPTLSSKISERTTTTVVIDENGAPAMTTSPWMRNRKQQSRTASFPPLRAHNDTVIVSPPAQVRSSLSVKAPAATGFIEKILELQEGQPPCTGKPRIPVDGTKGLRPRKSNSLADNGKPASSGSKDTQTKAQTRSDPGMVKLIKFPGENLSHKSPAKTTRLPSEDERKVEWGIKDELCKKQNMVSASKKTGNWTQSRNPGLERVGDWRFESDLQNHVSSSCSGSARPGLQCHAKHCICSSASDRKGRRTMEAADNVVEARHVNTSRSSLVMVGKAARKQTMEKRKESKGLRHGLNLQRPNKQGFVSDFRKANGARCGTRSDQRQMDQKKKDMDLDGSSVQKHDPTRTMPQSMTIQHDRLPNRYKRQRWIPCVFEEGLNRTYDLRIPQDALEFSCETSNADLSSTDDPCTPETKPLLELNSGKSTMMVLQELLLALKPSEGFVRQEEELKKCESNTLVLGTVNSSLKSDGCRDGRENRKISIEGVGCIQGLSASSLQRRTKNHVPEKCSEEGEHASRMSNVGHHMCEDSSTCFGSFTFTEDIEDNGCESFRCTSIIATESFKKDVQFTLKKGTKVIISSDQDYVKCILSSLKVCSSDVISTRRMQPSHPLFHSSLFDKLEELVQDKWYWNGSISASQKDFSHRQVAKLNRRLMFDCVLEALGSFAGNEKELQLSCALSFQDSLTVVARNVMRQIEMWKCMNCWLDVDEMLHEAMNTSWDGSTCEPHETVMEIVDSMIKDLIQELILELG